MRAVTKIWYFDYIEVNIDLVLNEHYYLGYSFEKSFSDNNKSDTGNK